MAETGVKDPFSALIPGWAEQMPVAWRQLCIPGPPPAFELTPAEASAAEPMQRYHRRTIAMFDCGAAGADRLALIDKASPHALYDLMLSEVSRGEKSTPVAVLPVTGRTLWCTGLAFVRFVSNPEVQQRFGLAGGRLHLALNCDPNTRDRESVQAAKQFHLHLLYWTAEELAALHRPDRLGTIADPRERRQYIDPLGFLGARIVAETISDLVSGIAGAVVLDSDTDAVCAGHRPLGCVIRLPGWQVLADPAFETLIRRLHRRMADTAAGLLAAFTGRSDPPRPWQRHALRAETEIAAAIDRLGLSATTSTGLRAVAAGLRDLSSRGAERLRRAAPAARKHCMTLNQPCYGINLYAPRCNSPDAPLSQSDEVYLIIQAKLFSGTGVAGLLALDGIPSVRIVRGLGTYSEADWRRRAALQQAFAEYQHAELAGCPGISRAPLRRLIDFGTGWALP